MEVDTQEDVRDKASEKIALLRKGSTDKVISCCLEEEINTRDISPDTYKFLLAAHLIKGDSDEARLLWLRVPSSLKSHTDLQRMWSIGRAMILEDYPSVYSVPSPTSLETLVLSSYTRRTLHTISVTYKSLSLAEFQTMTGLSSRESARETVDSLGWRREECAGSSAQNSVQNSAQNSAQEEFVFPSVPEKCPSKTVIGLSELASYISFLENV